MEGVSPKAGIVVEKPETLKFQLRSGRTKMTATRRIFRSKETAPQLFHMNFCRTAGGIVSRSSIVRKSIVLKRVSNAGGPQIFAPKLK